MATVLQIEDYWGDDNNPYQHNSGDTIGHMNLDYWVEQIKATIVMTAQLAVPVASQEQLYIPLLFSSFQGLENHLAQPGPLPTHTCRYRAYTLGH